MYDILYLYESDIRTIQPVKIAPVLPTTTKIALCVLLLASVYSSPVCCCLFHFKYCFVSFESGVFVFVSGFYFWITLLNILNRSYSIDFDSREITPKTTHVLAIQKKTTTTINNRNQTNNQKIIAFYQYILNFIVESFRFISLFLVVCSV